MKYRATYGGLTVRAYTIDVQLTAANVGVATLNFGTTFPALPIVVASPANTGSVTSWFACVDMLTTSDCRVVARHYDSTAATQLVKVSVLVVG